MCCLLDFQLLHFRVEEVRLGAEACGADSPVSTQLQPLEFTLKPASVCEHRAIPTTLPFIRPRKFWLRCSLLTKLSLKLDSY